eukprot:3859913-Alexandrium_andersonii.AAC.1
MRARPRPRLHMSSDSAQRHQCRSELHEGCRSISARGATPRVALDLMGYFFTDPQIPEGSTSFDKLTGSQKTLPMQVAYMDRGARMGGEEE